MKSEVKQTLTLASPTQLIVETTRDGRVGGAINNNEDGVQEELRARFLWPRRLRLGEETGGAIKAPLMGLLKLITFIPRRKRLGYGKSHFRIRAVSLIPCRVHRINALAASMDPAHWAVHVDSVQSSL
jgi:hypothetical protein